MRQRSWPIRVTVGLATVVLLGSQAFTPVAVDASGVAAAGVRAAGTRTATAKATVTRSWVFGHSVRGRPLRVYRIGDPSARRRVLVVGVVHGDERAGLKIVNRLRSTVPPAGVVYYLVPNLNPDGSARNTRQNARGVDLNRNFPRRWYRHGVRWSTYYSGPHASSEPETRAAERLIRSVAPTLTVWYHQHLDLIDPAAGPRADARAYAEATGLRVHRLVRYRGSASTWQGALWSTRPVLVVELSRRLSASGAARHARAVRTVSALPTG